MYIYLCIGVCPLTFCFNLPIHVADQQRESFIKENFPSANIIENHTVRRSHLYDDVIKLYSSEKIATEHPLFIVFEGERAVDFGVR